MNNAVKQGLVAFTCVVICSVLLGPFAILLGKLIYFLLFKV